MTTRDAIERAAFRAMQESQSADFHFLMAYKYGERDSLEMARNHSVKAIAHIDAALADKVAAE